MKTKLSILSIAAMLTLPQFTFSQGTYLVAPDGDPNPALMVNDQGSVGIGTTNPFVKLEVNGDVLLGSPSETTTGYGNTLNFSGVAENGEPVWMARYNRGVDQSDLRINIGNDGASDRLSIGYTAWFDGLWKDVMGIWGRNVGIGTSEPSFPLTVFGEYAGLKTIAHFGNQTATNGHGSAITIGNGNQFGWYSVKIAAVNENSSPSTLNPALTFSTMHNSYLPGTELERMRINSSGNVGIGTTTPYGRLDVVGDPGPPDFVRGQSGILRVGGTGAQHIQFGFEGNRTWIQSFGAVPLSINEGGNDVILNSGAGNVGIGTFYPDSKLDVAGKVRCEVLELTSDRNVKGGIVPIDSKHILEQLSRLPITKWYYTNSPSIGHIGPMAQDFHGAFNVGSDDKHIATVDADGVLFAAVQSLYQLAQEKDARIAVLERKLTEQERSLADRIYALEKNLGEMVLEREVLSVSENTRNTESASSSRRLNKNL